MARLHALLASGVTPPPVVHPKCKQCSLYELCMPELVADRAAYARAAGRAVHDSSRMTLRPEARRDGRGTLNTLYVVTRGASLRRDHLTVTVWVEQQRRLAVPIHQLEGIAVFGRAHVTPAVLHLCAEHGVAVTFLSESGRLVSRVDAPGSGNVLLRREQFRWADRPECRAWLSRAIVAGKVHNAREPVAAWGTRNRRSRGHGPTSVGRQAPGRCDPGAGRTDRRGRGPRSRG